MIHPFNTILFCVILTSSFILLKYVEKVEHALMHASSSMLENAVLQTWTLYIIKRKQNRYKRVQIYKIRIHGII